MELGVPLDADNGVLSRLYRRNRLAALVLGLLGLAFLAGGFLTFAARSLAAAIIVIVIALAVEIISLRLLRIALSWRTAAALTSAHAGHPGIVGKPVPLHAIRPGQPIKRKLVTTIIPIKTASGPLADGASLLVHGRQDGVKLLEGEQISAWRLGVDRDSGGKGRYLIRRESDQVLFAGSSSLISVT